MCHIVGCACEQVVGASFCCTVLPATRTVGAAHCVNACPGCCASAGRGVVLNLCFCCSVRYQDWHACTRTTWSTDDTRRSQGVTCCCHSGPRHCLLGSCLILFLVCGTLLLRWLRVFCVTALLLWTHAISDADARKDRASVSLWGFGVCKDKSP